MAQRMREREKVSEKQNRNKMETRRKVRELWITLLLTDLIICNWNVKP